MKIYIVGRISSDNPATYLLNVATGNALFNFLLTEGYHPYWGGMDLCALLTRDFLHRPNDHGSLVKLLQDNSIEWLKSSDVVVAMGNHKSSKGGQKELEVAQEIGIPIVEYENLDDLLKKLKEISESRSFPVYKLD